MKHLFFLVVTAVGLTCFQACNNQQGNEDSVDSAKEMNHDKDTSSMNSTDNSTSMSTTPVDKKDADFAAEAANGSMMEIAFGKLARDKAEIGRAHV